LINPKVQNRTLAANVIRLRVLFSNLPDSTRPSRDSRQFSAAVR
jgi:hypothetical protein